jgi:thioredoxin reductase
MNEPDPHRAHVDDDADEPTRDAVVIGGGAAGLSAALLLARARLRVAVVDAGSPRNAPAAHMQGYLSRDGLAPGELLATGRAEVVAYGGELMDGTVQAALPGFRVRLTDGRVLRARRLLVATGLRDELPDVPGVASRWGRDVLQCPYCHGHEVRDQALGVLATGPASVHQALLVSQWSRDVVLFEHTYSLSEVEREQVSALDIRIVSGEVTGLVVGEDGLSAVRATDAVVPRTALFVFPRFVAGTGPLTELGCETDEGGYLVVDATGATTTPGVWAAGNVVNPRAQVITAAGAAAAAAMAMHQDLVREHVHRAVETKRHSPGAPDSSSTAAGRR